MNRMHADAGRKAVLSPHRGCKAGKIRERQTSMGKQTSTKENILSVLEEKKGQTISGEELAARLCVSRSAVWKAMRELREAGYPIEASTRTGYCLRKSSDILSRAGILAALGTDAEAVGKELFYYDKLPSTNRLAKQLAVVEGLRKAIVVADSQQEGRGRYSHVFFSPAGTGLYLSFLLEAQTLPFHTPSFLTIYAAVVVCETIEALTGLSPAIKWVNDLYLGGKKICGILTEASADVETGQLQWVVCGIGVNVREPAGGFPENLPRAGALYGSGGRQVSGMKEKTECAAAPQPVSRNQLIAEIIRRFQKGLCPEGRQAAKPRSQAEILQAYRNRSFVLGREIEVLDLSERLVCRATALDLDEEGHLIVRKANGTKETLSTGEVHVRPEMG